MIFTRDFVTRENYWQIASLVTQKSLFTATHASFFISWIRIVSFWFIFRWPRVQWVSTGSDNGLVLKQATRHYLTWRWLSSLMHICVMRPWWVMHLIIIWRAPSPVVPCQSVVFVRTRNVQLNRQWSPHGPDYGAATDRVMSDCMGTKLQ